VLNVLRGIVNYGSPYCWLTTINEFIKLSAIKSIDDNLTIQQACEAIIIEYIDSLSWENIGSNNDTFFEEFWRLEILLYYIPSLICFPKDSAELDRLETTKLKITEIKDYITLGNNFLLSVINIIKKDLIP
jgi:hypothetical protein